MIVSRRQFLKTGLAGSVLLALSGWLNAAGARSLSDGEREMLAALANAILEGALPPEGERRHRLLALTVDGIASAVAGLSLAAQKEVGELFGLLVLAPGRLMLAGVGKPWREASVAEVSDFLQSWRSSRLSLLQTAYAALHDLTFAAWYGRSDTWDAIDYPGPPRGYF
ncbi:MAG TPA: twin-arginine translocation signal domain-containing protein [Accumulibacter sp.]|uniref:twin-arginine translocation signal domain-containing protein n=1 Tax=Accumulibacter sp. TaxID=2053492 RepID=UPI0025E11FD0|nr:twin-arginine translocation signal domain-containing protein [Accumulibacter sp.]MCM8599111.1 twin-arginine translocation signal domain-containing protein [Accumulibacter sp.]MCM8662413.1 twin-arginine translocation signal domain-containing protein [Accumulibacter sp.]HNC52142.1 twin-arginine translocation signal domain-containing protein [Accumulibacter sp.]